MYYTVHVIYMYILYNIHVIFTGDSGVVHVAEGLASNSTLEMLLLADNPFGDEGGLRLTEVLCTDNTTLKVLDLHGTHMTKVMERKVVEDLHQHGHLTKLGTAFGTKSPSPQHSFTEQNGLCGLWICGGIVCWTFYFHT